MANITLKRKTATGYIKMNPKIKVDNLLFAGSSSMADLLKTPDVVGLKTLYMKSTGFALGTYADIKTEFNFSDTSHHVEEHSTNFLSKISPEEYKSTTAYPKGAIVTFADYFFKSLGDGTGSPTTGHQPDDMGSSNTYWESLGTTSVTLATMLLTKVPLNGNNKVDGSYFNISNTKGMKHEGVANLTGTTLAAPTTLKLLFDSVLSKYDGTGAGLPGIVGSYLIVTVAGYVQNYNDVGTVKFNWYTNDDEDDSTAAILHLEVGDWIVLTNAETDYDHATWCSFAVINNTNSIATTTTSGLVQLSPATHTTRNTLSGSGIVDEAALRQVMKDIRLQVDIPILPTGAILSRASMSAGTLPVANPEGSFPVYALVGSSYTKTLYVNGGMAWEPFLPEVTFKHYHEGFQAECIYYDTVNSIAYKFIPADPTNGYSTSGAFSTALAEPAITNDLVMCLEYIET